MATQQASCPRAGRATAPCCPPQHPSSCRPLHACAAAPRRSAWRRCLQEKAGHRRASFFSWAWARRSHRPSSRGAAPCGRRLSYRRWAWRHCLRERLFGAKTSGPAQRFLQYTVLHHPLDSTAPSSTARTPPPRCHIRPQRRLPAPPCNAALLAVALPAARDGGCQEKKHKVGGEKQLPAAHAARHGRRPAARWRACCARSCAPLTVVVQRCRRTTGGHDMWQHAAAPQVCTRTPRRSRTAAAATAALQHQ
jgi:hypothetical protein